MIDGASPTGAVGTSGGAGSIAATGGDAVGAIGDGVSSIASIGTGTKGAGATGASTVDEIGASETGLDTTRTGLGAIGAIVTGPCWDPATELSANGADVTGVAVTGDCVAGTVGGTGADVTGAGVGVMGAPVTGAKDTGGANGATGLIGAVFGSSLLGRSPGMHSQTATKFLNDSQCSLDIIP